MAHVAVGSKPEKLNESKCFPLFTQQRTSPRYFSMSASCHNRLYASQRDGPLAGSRFGQFCWSNSSLRGAMATKQSTLVWRKAGLLRGACRLSSTWTPEQHDFRNEC